MIEIFKDISAVVGCISGIIALSAVMCRPLRKFFTDLVVKKSGKDEIQKQLDRLTEMMEHHLEADIEKQKRSDDDRTALLCLLRNSITRIYYAHLPERAIPANEYENLIHLFDAYNREGGNTYVQSIVKIVREQWTVIPDK